MRIDDLAKRAYANGKWDIAETLAREGLTQSEQHRRNWNYGNVIHNCHQILGLLSLHQGRQSKAAEHLLSAGRTPGSPQLDSFGPRMTLAKELLEAGEQAVVLQYLDLVALFWAKKNVRYPESEIRHKRLLKQWKKDVQAGTVPQHKQ